VSVASRLPVCMGGVRLRALREEDDLAVFLGYRSDPLVARYQGWSPMDEAKARAFLREHAAKADVDSTGHWLQLAIADAASDALIGDLGVWLSHDRSEAELGITLASSMQGRGIGRSAMRAACGMLFSDPAVVRIRADADARNTPCRRMLVAAGFREMGIAHVFVKEEACVEHRYIIERGIIGHDPAASTMTGDIA
jgi:RimJ/RimL family protein N-acetyltransferase